MEIKHLSPDFAVSPQIKITDLEHIWNAGFRSIICNRPNGEAQDQDNAEDIEAKARDMGFDFLFLPVESGRAAMPHAMQTRKALADMQSPVLAYCRTGTRCTVIWSLMMIPVLEANEILSATSAAGYDMSPLIAADD